MAHNWICGWHPVWHDLLVKARTAQLRPGLILYELFATVLATISTDPQPSFIVPAPFLFMRCSFFGYVLQDLVQLALPSLNRGFIQ